MDDQTWNQTRLKTYCLDLMIGVLPSRKVSSRQNCNNKQPDFPTLYTETLVFETTSEARNCEVSSLSNCCCFTSKLSLMFASFNVLLFSGLHLEWTRRKQEVCSRAERRSAWSLLRGPSHSHRLRVRRPITYRPRHNRTRTSVHWQRHRIQFTSLPLRLLACGVPCDVIVEL